MMARLWRSADLSICRTMNATHLRAIRALPCDPCGLTKQGGTAREGGMTFPHAHLLGIEPLAPADITAILDLAEGLQLRRSRRMGAQRIELTGFTEAMRERLRAYGLFTEIITWKLRFFVPVDAIGIEVLGKLFARFPVERIGEREAA
jgi:hypothetical protein